MRERVFFLNEERDGQEHHIFRGQYLRNSISTQEDYSLCHKVEKGQCHGAVIKNQTQETMQLLCEKSKRKICQDCQVLLKRTYYQPV